jgi:YVTN family beta-propeller protein
MLKRKCLSFALVAALPVLLLEGTVAAQPEKPASVEALAKGFMPGEARKSPPARFAGGADLPNGWRVTPAGRTIASTGDLITSLAVSPDGRVVVSANSGYLPHAIDVLDARTRKRTQHIDLHSTFLGMAWSADGHTLYVSGGNASGSKNRATPVAPIHVFHYAGGKLSEDPAGALRETVDAKRVWWSGLAYLPGSNRLYAANMMGPGPGNVVVFDAATRQIVHRIPVEVSPYQMVLAPDGKRLFVSNWSSESVSVIDTATDTVIATLRVGQNPNDMKLAADGRLFVACSNDNSVAVIDTARLRVMERISTTLTPLAPEGSTPDALAVDDARKLLYVANADNNSLAVVSIANRAHGAVIGFVPTGWYPSALALTDKGRMLFIGTAKGEAGHPDPRGPHSPLATNRVGDGDGSVHTLQTGSVEALPVADLKAKLPGWTRRVTENTPYNDSLLSEARRPLEASIIPTRVGETSPIKHVIYIIKENRTYDQVFGDLPNANGDPRLTLFGEKVTPNLHALAKTYVTFDNLYCDGEVSVDGHSWSNSAYATDFNEKQWPAAYGGHSVANYDVRANVPASGHLWDVARRKGLTYRSYGESGVRASTSAGPIMVAAPGSEGLVGHISPEFGAGLAVRDTDRLAVFLREFRDYEANYDSPDPEKRLPNYSVMWMGEDHTQGTTPGAYTPSAMVANNDYAIGQLVEAVSHSRYWASTAIFIIEDDAQDGSDHVDARRTVGLAISPYVKRGIVDSTLYSTSSMIRSMELLLGLPPMSQYDAAATPMYAAFGTAPVMTPFDALKPLTDVNAKNTERSAGAAESSKMNFSEVDRAPMRELNEIIWKSVRGADSEMPAPVHRFRPLIEAGHADDDGDEK